VKTDSGGNALWQKAYGNPNYAATFQKVGLTSDGGFVSGGWTLEFNNQNEAYIVKTDSGGDVNNCSDVQVTTATAGSLSETASLAKLSITVPLRGSYRDNRERSRAERASYNNSPNPEAARPSSAVWCRCILRSTTASSLYRSYFFFRRAPHFCLPHG